MPSDILLRVVETVSSTWSYHLRRVGSHLPLCGYDKQGVMMTHIPVAAWGVKSHLPSRWCPVCTKAMEEADAE